jgi:hypothetical protein
MTSADLLLGNTGKHMDLPDSSMEIETLNTVINIIIIQLHTSDVQ